MNGSEMRIPENLKYLGWNPFDSPNFGCKFSEISSGIIHVTLHDFHGNLIEFDGYVGILYAD